MSSKPTGIAIIRKIFSLVAIITHSSGAFASCEFLLADRLGLNLIQLHRDKSYFSEQVQRIGHEPALFCDLVHTTMLDDIKYYDNLFHKMICSVLDEGVPELRLAVDKDPYWKHEFFYWMGDFLNPQYMRHIAPMLQDGELFVDIGAGSGQPGLILGAARPGVKFLGLEVIEEKVKYANGLAKRFGLDNVEFIQQDLSDIHFNIPSAKYYYLFNPVRGLILEKVLGDIRRNFKPNVDTHVILRGMDPSYVSKMLNADCSMTYLDMGLDLLTCRSSISR